MGAISFSYNVKPKVIDALKQDMPLPIVDFNIDKLKTYPGCDDWQYCVYAACKYKNEVVCIIGLIKYDNFNKECYVKVYDETCGPQMTNISKQVFNKLTPLKEKSFAQEWRDKVKKKLLLKEEVMPVDGKLYALTGGPKDKCISNGNTWKESEVKS